MKMERWLASLMLRLQSLFRKETVENDFDEELRFHLENQVEQFVAQGMSPRAARKAATKLLAGVDRQKEQLRELWQFRWLENFWRDVSFSVRLLRKSPGFTAVALLTLALGVGANTAVFSLINGLLLRPLPVPHSEQLAVLRIEEGGPQPEYSFCTPFFRGLENRHDVFTDVFAYDPDMLQVQGHSGNENVPGMQVSGQFFSGLQVPPLLGRTLTPEDDRKGGSPAGLAVVISEGFWERWFDRAPDVVGRKLVIANTPFTVVGVMPKRFRGVDPTRSPEIYAPLSADPILDAPRNHIDGGIHSWWLTVMARVKPGISVDGVNAALQAVSGPILHDSTEDGNYIKGEEKAHFHFSAEAGSSGFTYARILFRKPLVAMFAMCGGILLLACLNLTSLLMARGAARERELATRLAMGAGRRRLIHQLLVESLLIATAGTALGLVAAPLVSRSLATMLMSGSGAQGVTLDTSLDVRVFLFAALVTVTATVLIGLVPALQATGGNLNEAIKDGQHANKTHERRRVLPRVLMASEVALALALVAGAGLLVTSLVKLYKSGAGFDPRGVVNIAFAMDKQPLKDDALMQVYQQLGEELSHQPGVKNVSFEFIVPLSHRGWNGRYAAPGGSPKLIWMNSVGPKYFETMRIPLYVGREFGWGDTKASGLKVILNQSAAKQFFPDRDAVGQQILNPGEKTSYEVVAVVGDAKYRDMRSPALAAAYVPIQQDTQEKPSLNAVVRVEGTQTPLAGAVRSIAARLVPSIPAPVMTGMDEVVDGSLGAERMMAVLAIFFAGCALLVTGIGLYGTLSYSTSRRTSEIGIRMALGAQRSRVMGMVFRENVLVAAIGSGAGLAVALLASRALGSFLYETSPRDPWVLVGSVGALTAIASAASLLPALRAARIEPIAAIRCE